MKFFRLNKLIGTRVRFDTEFYASRIVNESLGSSYWMHKIDTWKLPKFERLFIGSIDSVSNPMPWKSTVYWTLYLGTELRMYAVYMYMFYYYTRCVASTWVWLDFFTSELYSEYGIDMDVDPWEDLEDYDAEIEQDEDAWFFFHTQIVLFNNENPLLVYWKILSSQLYIAISYLNLTDVRCVKYTNSVVDNFLFNKLRQTFRTQFESNLFLHILKNLKVIYSILKNFVNCTKTVRSEKSIKGVIYVGNIVQPFLNVLSKTSLHKTNLLKSVYTKPIVLETQITGINISTFLRKQRIFTKSKYARSRQYCKNIVLLGLLLNVVLMFGLNLNYYAILVNSGFFMYPLYIFFILYSTYMFVKYRLHRMA